MKNPTVNNKFKRSVPLHDSGKKMKRLELFLIVCVIAGLTVTVSLVLPNLVFQAKVQLELSEKHQVMTATMMYVGDGKDITSSIKVTPSDKGVLEPYLQGKLSNSWTISPNGNVALTRKDG